MLFFDISSLWNGTKASDCTTSGPILPTPHGKWFHPEKTFAEKIVTFILELIFPFDKVISCQTVLGDSSDPETQEALRYFRRSMNTTSVKEYEAVVTKMKQKYQWEAAVFHDIPRKDNILINWGIVNDYSILAPINGAQSVSVYLHGPSKLIQPEFEEPVDPNSTSRLSKVLKLEDLPAVPIIIWFHGGGMMCNTAQDGRGPAYVGELLTLQEKLQRQVEQNHPEKNGGRGVGGQRYPDIVLVSVEYGLAPESPFPIGLIDCLSVVEHLIELYPSNPIHLAGESAGGNLAAVTAFECARKYPGRISSAFIMQPMLIPTADTMSYHMNSRSSYIPGEWLRWCWRAYLSFENGTATTFPNSRELHRHSYEQSKWRTGDNEDIQNWVRLFAPHLNLPKREELMGTC